MAQVLTSEGLAEFHATGKIPEFVKPVEDQPKPAEVKADPKVEPSVVSDKVEAAIEAEDDQGLTAVERTEFNEKMRRKIGAKHRAMREAEEFAEENYRERRAAEKRADDLAAEIAAMKSTAAPTPEDKEPSRADFASDAEYWDAKIDWKAAQAVKKDRAARAEEIRAAEAQKMEAERIARNKAFAAVTPDYEETVAALSDEDLMVPPHMSQYLYESDMSPQLMYHFAKNPEVFRDIAKLSPIKAVAAMGKLESKLEAKAPAVEPGKTPTSLSRAPAPIQALQDSATPVQKDPSKMSFDELRAYNREQRMRKSRH
jgi:hypothetical protein